MHKILFSLGSFPVHSYYVLWTAALMIGVWWSRKRMVRVYGSADAIAASVVFWALLGVYAGARLGSVLDNWGYFSAHPLKIISPFEGGLSAIPAFLGAGLFGILRSRKAGIPWWIPAEAASIPAITVVMIGRIGCFLNGCCYGIAASPPWGVHFPFDPPAFLRYPVQLYYSLAALLILVFLHFAESFFLKRFPLGNRKSAFMWPLFMICYGGMRFFLDHFRYDFYIAKPFNSMLLSGAVALWGLVWFLFSLYRNRRIPNI
ncbi:MAG TPA: prolipoprotein diacylglyceryl transferase [Synergistaceae bacterium]|nr:prolipoprotein diacylglyceryl transferase [Synergistaceae bacterium]HPJ25933.1 prolipoprotein diacylglyceryl transferase [Synergistaceae bacterium]HPQ37428.1 prolipoprotein diacylglyceryl transferase [Synergistaceae bacterium]